MVKNKKISNIILLAIIVLLPLVIRGSYSRGILILWAIYAILALSLNLIVGYMGLLSFGHAGFFGIGAYTSALVCLNLGFSFWPALLLTLIVVGVVGLGVGYFSIRLHGVYFAISTMAFSEIVRLIMTNWMSVTRGPMGLNDIPRPAFFGFNFSSELSYFYLVVAIAAVLYFIVHIIISSPLGRSFKSIRENQELSHSIGIDVAKTKVLAFTVSAMIAGVAGSLYAHYYTVIAPEVSGLFYSTVGLIMVIVGGKGTLLGPVIGAFIFTILPEALRATNQLQMIVFSLVLILTVIFLPNGLMSILKLSWGKQSRNKMVGR